MRTLHALIALLALPLSAAAPLSCAGIVAPGLAYPDPSGRWFGAELARCDQIAARLHRGPARFTPIWQSSDAPASGGADLLFLPRRAIPSGYRAAGVLADDYEAIMVPSRSLARRSADLANHPICVEPGSAEEQALAGYFAAHRLLLQEFVFQEVDEMHDAYLAGRCDAIVSPVSLLTGLRGNAADGRILPEHLSANPIMIATPIDRPTPEE